MSTAFQTATAESRSMNHLSETQNTNDRFKPGGGYCFQSWQGKRAETSKQRIQISVSEESKDEYSEWRHWMKEYLREKNEDEKSQTSNPDSQTEELAWNTHVQQAREIQKRRAQELASAVVSSRQARTTKMFQQRFERAEKFAFVSEPGDKRPHAPPAGVKEDKNTKEEKREEPAVKTNQEVLSPEEEEKLKPGAVSDDTTDGVEAFHPLLPSHLSFLNVSPSKEALLVSPKPWQFKTDPVPPSPPQKNFNRSPRGFVGSYLTSYH